MIGALHIKNFKCFGDLRLELGGLSMLTGFNGGGKSSALQPLLLLSQSLRRSSTAKVFALNGHLVQLGTAGDVLPSGADTSEVLFSIEGSRGVAAWVLAARAGDRFLTLVPTAGGISAESSDVDGSLRRLVYLSAVREGTGDAFPIPMDNTEVFDDIGMDGRFAPYWYDRFVDNEVPEERHHPDEPANSLRKQLDAWLGTLFPRAQANVQLLPQASLLSLQFRLHEMGAWRRPANIGYGLTYAFPILVALLVAQKGQVVIIDSPEAHLHPSAQSHMGRLLAHFASAGVQILVETHSDHLLNGIRLAVKSGVLETERLRIHFFSGVSADGHGVISPVVDKSGRIHDWPTGFFDQSDRDLSLLTDWT